MIYVVVTVVLLAIIAGSVALAIQIYSLWFGKNKPNEAWVFVEVGEAYLHFRGRLLTETKKGKSYVYGHNEIVLVPSDQSSFPVRYWKRRRVIVVRSGNLIASSLGFTTFDDADKKTLVQHLTLSHIGSEMLKAMSSTSAGFAMWLIIIIIIVAVVGGGVFAYNYMQKQRVPTQKAQPTQTLPPSGEVK